MALLTQTQAMAHLPHSEATATVDQEGGLEGALEHDDDQTEIAYPTDTAGARGKGEETRTTNLPLLNTFLLAQPVP